MNPTPPPSPVSPAAAASPVPPVDVSDYVRLAPSRMSTMAWEYVSGGAADEVTLGWNEERYRSLRLRPDFLVDVSKIDTRVTLFGQEMSFPLLLAPAAYQKLLHPEGEIATVKGAGLAGATMVLSTTSTVSIEDTARVATHPLWFQLYVQPDREVTRSLVQRAEAAGCRALVITIDSPVLGPRYRETRSRFTLPAGMERANLRGLKAATGAQRATGGTIYSAVQDPTVTWADVAWLRSLTSLPVLLKGIMHPDDAARAVDAGVQGIIVSNHGGRNVDTVPATIDALAPVAERVAGRIPVLVDGGVRRGTDILKAVALGASAVLIGRPYLYGLAVGGAEGVAHVISVLRRELEMAMASTGRPTIASINSSVLWR